MNSYFSPEALAALQQAYEMQLTPEQQDIDEYTGLPSNTVSNTSPWHGSVDLWKYPDGKNKLETAPIMYRSAEDEYDEDEIEDGGYEVDDELDEDSDLLSDEEIDTLIEELLNSDEDDEV